MTSFDFDTETFLLAPAIQAPPLVCIQFLHADETRPQLIHARDPACRRWVEYALQHAHLSAFNLGFDAAVLMAAYPDLIPAFFDALDQNRVTCTMLGARLLDIATGDFKRLSKVQGSYALDGVARRLRVPLLIDKEDPWRLRYGTLYHTDCEAWPEDAVRYALTDAVAQRAVRVALQARGDELAVKLSQELGRPVHPLRNWHAQTRRAVWMRLMECRGICTDRAHVERYIADVRAALDEDLLVAQAAGLVRPDGTRDTKAAMLRMVQCCADEPELPITDTGLERMEKEGLTSWELWRRTLAESEAANDRKRVEWEARAARARARGRGRQVKPLQLPPACGQYIKLDEDSCNLFGDEVLEAYQRCTVAAVQVARAERLRNSPIQPSFQTLIDTGRTACRQGDTEPGRPVTAWGFQLQNPTKDRKRKSDGKLIKGVRECFVPRPGYLFLSTDYSAMELCGWAQACLRLVGYSKMAEVINEGRDPHVELGAQLAGISAAEAYARFNGERGPELQAEFKKKYRQAAKPANFGFPGGMGARKMVLAARKGYDVHLTLQQAQDLRAAWMATWPEARDYFNVANRMLGDGLREHCTVEQLGSDRLRGKCFYTHINNGWFQGLCADIATEACYEISREMYARPSSPLYGSRLVNFLHDEPFSEVLEDRAHEAALRQSAIQEDVAARWAPDVRWTAQPALMRRWYKDAEPVYRDGHLVPWEPKAA